MLANSLQGMVHAQYDLFEWLLTLTETLTRKCKWTLSHSWIEELCEGMDVGVHVGKGHFVGIPPPMELNPVKLQAIEYRKPSWWMIDSSRLHDCQTPWHYCPTSYHGKFCEPTQRVERTDCYLTYDLQWHIVFYVTMVASWMHNIIKQSCVLVYLKMCTGGDIPWLYSKDPHYQPKMVAHMWV